MDLEIVDDLKQPEYTGENRCEPCTILNLAIAAVVGSLVARKSRVGALLAVGVSIALIYLRGYLVPGTPTLTKRYLPPEVLRWFGKDPEPEVASGLGGVDTTPADDVARTDVTDANAAPSRAGEVATDDEDGADAGDETTTSAGDGESDTDTADTDPGADTSADDEVDLETYFLEHDVLEPCADRDDLCLTDGFEDAWLAKIETVDESGVDVAAAVDAFGFEADPEEFELDSRGDTQLLVARRGAAGRWPSRAALVADVAASRALETWVPDWDVHDPETTGRILNGLRMFLETCPTAEGGISMSEETVESCCSTHEVIAVTCDETGDRIFEHRVGPSAIRANR